LLTVGARFGSDNVSTPSSKARIRTFFGDFGRQIARGPGFKPLD